MDFSLIIPCYNEEENLPYFFSTLTECFDMSGLDYEMIFVNDGSTDGSSKILRDFPREHAGVKVIGFSRNFGKEAAIYAGLGRAEGDAVCIIDSDMQQDPATALEMYRFLMEHPDYDCVAACQETRKESAMLRHWKKRFYKIFQRLHSGEVIEDASDFRVFRRSVVDALLSMPEYYRFSKGLFAWVGFNTYPYPYTPSPRFAGNTKWRVRDLFKYALNGLISFTTFPLRIAAYLGFIAALVAGIYLVVIVCEKIFAHTPVPGYPTLVGLILLIGGIQLLVLGIMGEYLARDYIEGKHRPIFIEKEYLSSPPEKDDKAAKSAIPAPPMPRPPRQG